MSHVGGGEDLRRLALLDALAQQSRRAEDRLRTFASLKLAMTSVSATRRLPAA